jgi:hypothetical protein
MARSPVAALLVPHPPLLWRILRTTLVVWTGFHFALAVLGIAVPDPLSALVIVGVCAAAVWLDLRHHAEHLFYANLGVAPAWSAATAACIAGAGEAAFQLIARLGG